MVRAAWFADWNRENEWRLIGYKFTKKTATFDSQLGNENGALIEAGLDYTIQNFNSTLVKVYARVGMELCWATASPSISYPLDWGLRLSMNESFVMA